VRIKCVDCDEKFDVLCTREGRESYFTIPKHFETEERGWLTVVGEQHQRFADIRRLCPASEAHVKVSGPR